VGPGLKMGMSDDYSDHELKRVLAKADAWYIAFAETPEFKTLSKARQRDAGAIIEFFAQYSYTYVALTPEEWNVSGVIELCTDVLPRKISAGPDFFAAISPVLFAFFSYLARHSLVRDGDGMAEAARDCHDEIVTNSQDRSSWGPAKHFVMAAREAGVDIHNPEALNAFMVGFNLRMTAGMRSRTTAPPWPDAESVALSKPKVAPPLGRYDPCPCGSGKKYKFCCQARQAA
jgi:hypothetical protein